MRATIPAEDAPPLPDLVGRRFDLRRTGLQTVLLEADRTFQMFTRTEANSTERTCFLTSGETVAVIAGSSAA